MLRHIHNEPPIKISAKEGASSLFVFFSSIAASRAVPAFEYSNVSEGINAHRIHVRDLDRCYYHTGLPGLTENVYSTAEYLEKLIREFDTQRIVFLGGSMGGFAAIMFAALTKTHEVIAFGPRTYLTPWLRFKNNSHTASKWMNRMYRKCVFKPKIWDLRKLLLNTDFSQDISIYFAAQNRVDQTHINHIRDIPGVRIFERPVDTHGVKHLFPNKSELREILVMACEGRHPG